MTGYDGGRGAWRVTANRGDIHLTVSASDSSATAMVTADLSDDDIDDLVLALGRAREARAAYAIERWETTA